MKKINYKKVLVTVLWIIAIAGLFASLNFVSKSESNVVAKKLDVIIENNEENFFLNEGELKNYFKEKKINIVSNSYSKIDFPLVEKLLNEHPSIQNAEVSHNLKGEVKIDIVQRTPIVRVINKSGESYYIDSQSKLMPLSDNYSARVLVVSGELFEPYENRKLFSVKQIQKSKTYRELSLLDDIWELSNYIQSDSSLTNLIQQVNINSDREMELYPAIGNHKIYFGSTENMKQKFNKLKLFYTQGLNKSDAWNKYSVINLKYKNLVVCTKK